MSIVVVGSVAFDSIKTPAGEVEGVLGGAANYFSVAATIFHRPVQLVAVVGEDFPKEHEAFLESRGIDLAGLVHVPGGKTFHWKGFYEGDMNQAETLETHLNVFADFAPDLPASYREAEYVFLANIDPALQMRVMDQIKNPKFTAMDTMNLWINIKHDELKQVISRVNMLVMNDAEAQMFTEEPNLVIAAKKIQAMGPRVVVVKKGVHGAMVLADDEYIMVPAFPLDAVVDPTGAGDTFGGGMMGYMASKGATLDDHETLREAIAHGAIVASYNVQSFSMDRLKTVSPDDVKARVEQLRKIASF